MKGQITDNFRVLIVEDNPINQKVIRIILERNGWDFSVAQDGLEAVEQFKRGDFSLVLMDCQMPKLDGLQACIRIRQIESEGERGRCPIVAMTANAMKGDRDKCLEAGMDDFLAKPFKSQELVQIISTWRTK